MSNSVYPINKGINKAIEFKGLKAQYIWWLGGGLIGLLLLFTVLYLIGLNIFICLAIIAISGSALFIYVYRMNNTYGEYGLMKKLAQHRLPELLISYSRKQFYYGKKTGKNIPYPGR